ncbi:hypothetical protein CKM354_000460000 [Cercospora kikuchii]|uniref:Uncharacterized protein n=1 Tax=Cercospora kikuchii TaxID=84275 RepID=A0A9P3CBQ7_9PEZI|nr:uncharacterized protein CKM354_000460000 [Cercospora kikuchii]GIZ41289.1 hypothetical protein CKM354_000460000 [Cercospora kikuchii]
MLLQIRQSGGNERTARTATAMEMLCITAKVCCDEIEDENSALREAKQSFCKGKEELDARSKRITERESQVQIAKERASSPNEEFARLKLGENSLNAQRELVEKSFASATSMVAENGRLEERVHGLEQMIKLPNGQTLADRIAVLTYENNNLTTQLSQAKSEAAKAAIMEKTVQKMQNEIQRRDAMSSSSSSFISQAPQNPQNILETSVASHSSKRHHR